MPVEVDSITRGGLPTAAEADAVYDALMSAAALLDGLSGRVRLAASSSDGSELGFVVDYASIGVVAAIAADLKDRAETFAELANELERAVFDLDGIRRLQRDADEAERRAA